MHELINDFVQVATPMGFKFEKADKFKPSKMNKEKLEFWCLAKGIEFNDMVNAIVASQAKRPANPHASIENRVSYGEYNGNKLITITPVKTHSNGEVERLKPLSFGVTKARMILDCLEHIEAFVNAQAKQ